MQMKNTLTHIVNYEKTIFDKKSNLNLQPENLAGYYLCKGIFLYVFLYPERYYTSGKLNNSLN